MSREFANLSMEIIKTLRKLCAEGLPSASDLSIILTGKVQVGIVGETHFVIELNELIAPQRIDVVIDDECEDNCEEMIDLTQDDVEAQQKLKPPGRACGVQTEVSGLHKEHVTMRNMESQTVIERHNVEVQTLPDAIVSNFPAFLYIDVAEGNALKNEAGDSTRLSHDYFEKSSGLEKSSGQRIFEPANRDSNNELLSSEEGDDSNRPDHDCSKLKSISDQRRFKPLSKNHNNAKRSASIAQHQSSRRSASIKLRLRSQKSDLVKGKQL